MNRLPNIVLLAPAFLLALPGCFTRRHCKNNGDCPEGSLCNLETEQCYEEPCIGHAPGDFVRCDGPFLVRCDALAAAERIDCGTPGCNDSTAQCNECEPGTTRCALDTFTSCDASGHLIARIDCVSGCTESGCITTCGNGVTEPPEVCDDGNHANGDGCSADCLSDESCGNGVLDLAAGEVCDDGNYVDGDGCSADCQSDESCGNGITDLAAGEVCDDGNHANGDGCSADCRSDEICGNGYVDLAMGEECDDANATPWDGCDGCAITELQVNTTAIGDQDFPAVAAAADGSFVVAWVDIPNHVDPSRVLAQRFDPMGRRLGAELEINAPGETAEVPRIAAAADGSFAVVWQIPPDPNGNRAVAWRLFDTQGSPVGPAVQQPPAVAESSENPTIGMAGDGHFMVSWEETGPTFQFRSRVYAARFDPLGGQIGQSVQVNESTDAPRLAPEIAMSPAGAAVVAWLGLSSGASGTHVFWRQYDSAGLATGPENELRPMPESHGGHSVTANASGDFVIGYTRHSLDGFTHLGTFATWFHSSGSEFSNRQANVTQGRMTKTAVVLTDLGRVQVFWEQQGIDGDSYGLALRGYDGSTLPSTAELGVNDYALNYQGSPRAAYSTNGTVVLVWSSNTQDGEGTGIFAQRFDGQGNRLGVGQ